jgi:hypothetical protein
MSTFPHWLLAALLLAGLLSSHPIQSQASYRQPNNVQTYQVGHINHIYRNSSRF